MQSRLPKMRLDLQRFKITNSEMSASGPDPPQGSISEIKDGVPLHLSVHFTLGKVLFGRATSSLESLVEPMLSF